MKKMIKMIAQQTETKLNVWLMIKEKVHQSRQGLFRRLIQINKHTVCDSEHGIATATLISITAAIKCTLENKSDGNFIEIKQNEKVPLPSPSLIPKSYWRIITNQVELMYSGRHRSDGENETEDRGGGGYIIMKRRKQIL